MTGNRSARHDTARYEELISASLTGDLLPAEEQELREHLPTCAECRATMKAFSQQRRDLSGMRHVPLPRDMGARVRAGIETGRFAPLPWWRRPATMVAAAATATSALAAGVVVAFLIASPDSGPIADVPTSTPTPTLAPTPTPEPEPTATLAATPSPSPEATPVPTPAPLIGHGKVNFLAVSGTQAQLDTALMSHDAEGSGEERVVTIRQPRPGAPVTVSLSTDYEEPWLAYQTEDGMSGWNTIWAVHVATGETLELGRTDGSVFAKRMTWSPDGRYLAYTAADPERELGPDVWIFDAQTGAFEQLTGTGRAYAASFRPDGELWISLAGETPVSYVMPLEAEIDPPWSEDEIRRVAIDEWPTFFLPILSPDGERAIFWEGRMASTEPGWHFAEGGRLFVGGGTGQGELHEPRAIFPDVPDRRDAIASAEVDWSYDSDWFTVWNARWTGDPAAGPDERAVYFGQATGELIGLDDAIRLVGDTGMIADVTFVAYDSENPGPAAAVAIIDDIGGESGESPGPQGRLVVVPTVGIDGVLATLGEDADYAGPAFYVPQGNEGQ